MRLPLFELPEGPGGVIGHGGIGIADELLQNIPEARIPAVPHGNHGVTANPGKLRALYRRAAKTGAELLSAHFREPIEGRIDEFGPGLEVSGVGCWSLVVPWADLLADVTAENVVSHPGPHRLGNISALLNREIRNALVGIELVGCDERIRGTSFNTACTGTTAIRRGEVRRKLKGSKDHSKEKPRAHLLVQDAGILADPADSRIFGVDTLDERTGVDIAAGLDFGLCWLHFAVAGAPVLSG